MNNKIHKPQPYHLFPLQQLHKIVQHDKYSHKKINSKKLLQPKSAIKNQSKSLYYYNQPNRNHKYHAPSILNSTGLNLINQNTAQQTLNQQLLGRQKPKPQTSDYRSSRGDQYQRLNRELKSNKISLRSSSNYNNALTSVAGIQLNQKEAQQRMQSYMSTKNNVRLNKIKEIQKQNKKIASRLSSQQSQYSAKKILKQYESQQRISKRLTQSKMSKRSNQSIDNRSVCSQNSSRASARSRSSRNSNDNSMKSTGRINSSNSSSNKKGNRFQSKFQPTKKIKIVQHNINKMNQDDLSKFKSLFANSFNTKNNTKVNTQNMHNQNQLYNRKMLSNNPYVDVQIISQKSETSIKNIKPQKQSYLSSISNSNRKLKQINNDSTDRNYNDKIYKKSSAITSDGLLHRIVEQMYSGNNEDKKASTTNLIYHMGRGKKESNSTNKTTNPQVYKTQKVIKGISKSSHKKRVIRDEFKNSIFSNQFFTNKI